MFEPPSAEPEPPCWRIETMKRTQKETEIIKEKYDTKGESLKYICKYFEIYKHNHFALRARADAEMLTKI